MHCVENLNKINIYDRKAILKPLEEKKRNYEEALCSKQPESQEKHQQLKKLEQDLESTLSETNRR